MSVSLRNSLQYKVPSLSGIRKIVIGLLVLSAFLLLLLSSSPFLLKSNADTLASKFNNNHRDSSILSTHDMDGDGLSDVLEGQLGTLVNDSKGDLDKDGLYDFEEYLDYYGDNDQSNGRKYKYNDSTTFDDDNNEPILDIYHHFDFPSNRSGYVRESFKEKGVGGFTNYLLWNVTFSPDHAGGVGDGEGDPVLYLNNTIVGSTFSAQGTGGSQAGITNYTNNVVLDTRFTGFISGGGEYGGDNATSLVVHYKNNTFTNVVFSGEGAGGAQQITGGILYNLNTFTNVNFTGLYAGGTSGGSVTYGNNSFTSVIFSGRDAGFSVNLATKYENNTFDRVQFRGTQNLNLAKFSSADNTIVENGDTYDSDGDKLNDLHELLTLGTNPSKLDTDGDSLGDRWEVKYNGTSGVNPLIVADSELSSDMDSDGLNLSLEAKAFTNPDNPDTDGDGLNDSYEFLTLGTNATSADTDGDGLNDSYEFLTLGTNATSADTDGDGLGDGWEVKYNGTSGVNPLVAATAEELASDTDNDGLNLTEEFKANLDPGTADNPMQMNTTSTTASASSSSENSETSDEGSFTLLVVLAVFASFSLVFVVYRMRRRML